MIRYCLLLFIILSNLDSSSQLTRSVIFHSYTPSDGLSSFNVTRIYQDSYGFMWIGTQDGINRFDGRKFDQIVANNPDPERRLDGNNVSDFTEDTITHSLWVATSYGGLNCIDTKTFAIIRRITHFDQINLTKKLARTITFLRNKIWLGTDKGFIGLDLNSGKSIRLQSSEPFLDSLMVLRSFVDESGRVWAFTTNGGILVFNSENGNIIHRYTVADLGVKLPKKQLNYGQPCRTNDGQIFVPTDFGILLFDASSSSIQFKGLLPGYEMETFGCTVDKKGNLIYSTKDGLYFNKGIISANPIKIENAGAPWDDKIIYKIFTDRENNIWLGAHDGIAFINDQPSPFKPVHQFDKRGEDINHVYSICPANDSLIYAGGEDGIFEVDLARKMISHIKQDLPFYLIFRINTNTFFTSSTSGPFILQNGALKPAADVYPELTPLRTDLLNSVIENGPNVFYLGSQRRNGYYKWDLKKHILEHYQSEIKDSIDNNVINALFLDSDKSIKVLSEYTFKSFNPDNNEQKLHSLSQSKILKPYGILFDMCETKANYWFAAYGTGIIKTDKQFNIQKIITQEEGLSNHGVNKILPYGDSLLICSSNLGLNIYNIHTDHISTYYDFDGLQSSSFEQFSGTEKNGRVYLGGVNGFTIIDPTLLQINKLAPLFYFTKVKTLNRSDSTQNWNLEMSHLHIPSGWLQTTVSFSALNYSNPLRVFFRYRIKEQDSTWINLGQQDFVSLIGLSTGRYSLEVQASNENGIWSTPSILTLTFLPKWYQTWWFKLLLVVSLIGCIYLLYRIRINQLKKEQQIRTKLASDLHDDLGSTLNSVKVYTSLALREQEKEKHLYKIKESTQEAITGIKDIIWVLDDRKDFVEDLIARLHQFALPVCEANGISYQENLGENARSIRLGREEKRNLYMMLKEAINNAIKYSGADTLIFAIELERNKLQFSVIDDGSGFDADSNSEGNGLKNMRRRANQIKYDLDIHSKPGNGTAIRFRKC